MSRSPPGASRGRIGWPPQRGWGPVPQPGGQQADLFAERSYGADANPGLALIRDGNGTRSFETLLHYRGAAMAESWRVLKTLKALQAEQARDTDPALAEHVMRPAARPPLVHRPQPDEPEHRAAPGTRAERADRPGRALHESAAPWLPSGPEAGPVRPAPSAPASRTNPRPQSNAARPLAARPGAGQANPQLVSDVLRRELEG